MATSSKFEPGIQPSCQHPKAVLASLARDGITLATNGTALVAKPKDRITGNHRRLIREHKIALIELLAAPALMPDEHADIQEAVEERAAIREFDGGESRHEAESQARAETRVYRYKLIDKPDTWLTMIAPNCDLENARRSLEGRFEHRLMAVIAYEWRKNR